MVNSNNITISSFCRISVAATKYEELLGILSAKIMGRCWLFKSLFFFLIPLQVKGWQRLSETYHKLEIHETDSFSSPQKEPILPTP